MADILSENETKQSEPLTNLYRDIDGRYRWTYEMIANENPSYRNTLLLIFALVILVPGLILFFMIFGRGISSGDWDGAGSYLLILLGIFALTEALTVLIYDAVDKIRGGSKPIPYAMDVDCIDLYPNYRKTPRAYIRTFYNTVNDIRVKPEYDEIDLLEFARITQIYVYPEDRAFVLNFLFDHLPQKGTIQKRREEYKEYL